MLKTVVAGGLLVLQASMGFAQDLGRIGLPLLVSIPTAPIPVRADGKYRLVYELHLTNTDAKTVTLTRVDVWGTDKLATIAGDELLHAMKPTGADTKEFRTIPPGSHAVVLMWLTLDGVPDTLRHRVEGLVDADPDPLALEYSIRPAGRTPVRLAPPLRGDRWLAANGPANDTHHRRSWLAHEGRALFPERFAIDFLRVYENSLTNGDPSDNRNFRSYGAEVVAVADARVAAVTDGIPDNVPANRAPQGFTLETIAGNLVVLDLGKGLYAFYAHLQPGSIRVKPGDRVRVGQILGLVGNSGNGNAPHLHFQVNDGPSILLSDGVPFVFDSFTHDGRTRTNEIPLRNWIVNFR